MSEDLKVTIGARSARARLLVADFVQRNEGIQIAENADLILRRVGRTVTALADQNELLFRLEAEQIVPKQTAPKAIETARKGRRALLAAANKLKDPNNDVGDVVKTKSIDDALFAAENIIKFRNQAIENAFITFRNQHRPGDLNEVQAEGIEPLTLSVKVRRLQNVLASQTQVSSSAVLTELDKFRDALRDWEELRPQIEAAQNRISPALADFFRQIPQGVAWQGLNDEVREWLDSGSNGDDYILVRRDRHP
jgi:hypothetical protein